MGFDSMWHGCASPQTGVLTRTVSTAVYEYTARCLPAPCSHHRAEHGKSRQAASKTNDTAGDGTTTATILSAAIIAEGMKIVAAGTNPVQLTRGIEKTVTALVKELKALSVDVSDDDLANVATVSAGNNEVVRAPRRAHLDSRNILGCVQDLVQAPGHRLRGLIRVFAACVTACGFDVTTAHWWCIG